MNFHSRKALVLTLSLFAAQSVSASTKWIGVECTYVPSDESEIVDKIKKTEKAGVVSSNVEQTTEVAKNLYEIKHKFFINEYSKNVRGISNAIFENDKIHIKMHSERGPYRIVLFRNGYTHSTLFIRSTSNAPSHYTGKCHSITLQSNDVFPAIYPSAIRGF